MTGPKHKLTETEFDPAAWLASAERLGWRVFIFEWPPEKPPRIAFEGGPIGIVDGEVELWNAITQPKDARAAKKGALMAHLRKIGQVWPNRGGAAS